jgi:hypothetical protein
MDPVSALSLAANIYTFVEVGFKVVHQYNNFRRSALRETGDNAERRKITENLRNVSHKLVIDGPPFLTDLGKNCSELCKELLELLDTLTLKNPNSVFERVWIIFRCWLKLSDISSLEDRLEMYRRQLMVGFLQTLRYDNPLPVWRKKGEGAVE